MQFYKLPVQILQITIQHHTNYTSIQEQEQYSLQTTAELQQYLRFRNLERFHVISHHLQLLFQF